MRGFFLVELIIGWNDGQKNGSNMGKRGNQNFVVIPTGRLIERVKYPQTPLTLRLGLRVSLAVALLGIPKKWVSGTKSGLSLTQRLWHFCLYPLGGGTRAATRLPQAV